MCKQFHTMKKLIIFSTIILLLFSCSSPKGEETQISEAVLDTIITSVDSIDAVSGATNVENALMINGTITIPPENNITISLPISGIITSFSLLPGTYVRKGETIAVLENTEFIDMQQSYLDAASQTEYLETEYNRQKNLADQDVTSKKKYQESKAYFLSSKSKKEAMAAKLSMLGISPSKVESDGIVEKLVVIAPKSGYISYVGVNKGKYINAGESICQIINKSEILLSLITYEKDINKLEIGQIIEFKVNGIEGKMYKAVITAIDQNVDSVNRSIRVYAKSKTTEDYFRPGMYVIAIIK